MQGEGRPMRGVALVVAATLLFATGDTLGKHLAMLYAAPLILSARYLINLVLVAVTMALHIAQPEVEVLGQQRQHRRVDTPAIAIAVQEMQQRLARRRRVPAAQGEAGRGVVRPGQQLH